MNHRMRRAAASSIMTLLVAGAAIPASSAAASASSVRPHSVCSRWVTCPTVTGTAKAYPTLNVRTGPGTGYSIVGSMPYNTSGTVGCYTTGDNINGNSFWDLIKLGDGTTGFVSDYWLYTGGDITGQVLHC